MRFYKLMESSFRVLHEKHVCTLELSAKFTQLNKMCMLQVKIFFSFLYDFNQIFLMYILAPSIFRFFSFPYDSIFCYANEHENGRFEKALHRNIYLLLAFLK